MFGLLTLERTGPTKGWAPLPLPSLNEHGRRMSQRREMFRTTFSQLPEPILVDIIGRLPAPSIGSVLSVCRAFSSVANEAWRAACFRRWPQWSAIAEDPAAHWRRQYELLSLREAEEAALPNVEAVKRVQKQVNERHRTILTEWLCEVSVDFELDSTVVFKAVAYLDSYLSEINVEALSRFQLLGLSCLRAAMGDARMPTALGLSKGLKQGGMHMKEALDPSRFAYISDNTYTAAEVEECTQAVAAAVPEHLKCAPNAKMFLRSFWYRALLHNVVQNDEMHIYQLAGFLLELSLLDLTCSGFTASKLAAAALHVALAVHGHPEWPRSLQQFGSYTAANLEAATARLLELQATQPAAQLRAMWRQKFEGHAYHEYKHEWDRVLLIFSGCSRLLPGADAAASVLVDGSKSTARGRPDAAVVAAGAEGEPDGLVTPDAVDAMQLD